MRNFKTADRWNHGSIYELTKRTDPIVGPGSFNADYRRKKPS